MQWALLLFVGAVLGVVPPRARRDLAPSVNLAKFLDDAALIERLADVNHRVRCFLGRVRSKRMVGPAQRLDELISPLVLDPSSFQDDC